MTSALSWVQAAAWRFARHRLSDRAGAADALSVVARLGGLHAQVMSSAELSLHARVEGLPRDAVARALWDERTLYKTWAMRGTLHLLPAAERGEWQGALGSYAHYSKAGWLKGFGITRDQLETLIAAVGESLRGELLTRRELAAAVTERTGDPDMGEKVNGSWGPYLKPAAFRGFLCFGPSVGQNVRFTNPETWLAPAETVAVDSALAALVRRYLGAYGPATREDFSRWWSGVSPSGARRLLEGMGEEVARVDVDGVPAYVLAEHLDGLRGAAPEKVVRLLPAFDPYVAGAPREGYGIFPSERRAEIYRQAGWLTPVLVVDGAIAGVFRHERKGPRLVVEMQPWSPLPRWVRAGLEAEAERLAEWLHLRLDLTVAPV